MTDRTDPRTTAAQAQLDDLVTTTRRREARIDRRVLGWSLVVRGVLAAVAVCVAIVAFRGEAPFVTTPLLLPLIACDQVIAGMTGRNGARSYLAPRWWTIVGGVVFGVLVVAASVILILIPEPLPTFVLAAPGAAIAVVGAVLGARQLRGAHAPSSVGRVAPMPLAHRLVTIVIGVLLALSGAAIGTTSPVAATICTGIALMVLIAVRFLDREESMAAMAESWRWPQLLAFTASLAIVLCLALVRVYGIALGLFVPIIVPVVIVVLHTAVAFLGGRRAG